MTDNIRLLDKTVAFDEDADGLIIKETQYVPDDFVATLKREKIDTLHTPEGEFMRVCSIPTAVVDKWLREGFDVSREPIQATLKRLRNEHLDAFITTNKRV